MPNPKVVEAASGLRDDLPTRLLFSLLAQNLAEVCNIVSLLGQKDLPPVLLSRLKGIEAELLEMSHLCQFPPVTLSKHKVQI
jgi:hypothetical protein